MLATRSMHTPITEPRKYSGIGTFCRWDRGVGLKNGTVFLKCAQEAV